MPPRKQTPVDALCLVIDVGITSSRSGFADSAFKLMSELVQRKLYSEEPDLFGIVVLGSKGTDNPLRYPNITIAKHNNGFFTKSDFNIVQYLERHIKAEKSDNEVDWILGLEVGLNYLNNEMPECSGCKKLVLVSDIACPCDESRYDSLLENTMRNNVEVVFFSPEWQENPTEDQDPQNGFGSNHQKPMNSQQISNYGAVNSLVESTNGISVNINDALLTFMTKTRKKKGSSAFKVPLQIGPDIFIQVAGYIQVRKEAPKSWKSCIATDPDSNEIKAVTTYVRVNEDGDEIEKADLTDSYRYGSEKIPLSEINKKAIGYQGGEGKSLEALGFLAKDKIPHHYLCGDGSMIFMPIDDDAKALTEYAALTRAMCEGKFALVVRKVYRKGSSPRLGLLMPEERLNDNGEMKIILAFIELPFDEDIRSFWFHPLESNNDKTKPSDEQLQAVDDLIDSMMDSSGDGIETRELVNPFYQHLYNCLTYRALNPGKILPDFDKNDHAKSIMSQSNEITSNAKRPLAEISKLFKLEVVAQKKYDKMTSESAFGGPKRQANGNETEDLNGDAVKKFKADDLSLSSSSMSSVTEVSTMTPVEDFEKLLDLGFQFGAIIVQMEKVILELLRVMFGNQKNEKILNCIKSYRKASLNEKRNAGHFNQFMLELKDQLVSEKKQFFWSTLKDEQITMITVGENPSSSITTDEAALYLANDEKKEVFGAGDDDDDSNVINDEDLLDDL